MERLTLTDYVAEPLPKVNFFPLHYLIRTIKCKITYIQGLKTHNYKFQLNFTCLSIINIQALTYILFYKLEIDKIFNAVF